MQSDAARLILTIIVSPLVGGILALVVFPRLWPRLRRLRQRWQVADAPARVVEPSLASDLLLSLGEEIPKGLKGIQGMQALVLAGELAQDARECLQVAQETTEAISALLADVVDLAALEAGTLQLRREPLSPAGVLRAAVLQVEGRAAAKRLRMDVEPDPTLPFEVRGDEVRLKQVLVTLLRAMIYPAHDGRLKVAARGARDGRGGCVIEFAIGGTGPAPEARFEIFREAPGPRRLNPLGLALTVCERLVRAMGGTFDAEGDAEARFRFSVPFELVSAPTLTEASVQTARSLVNLALVGQHEADSGAPLEILVAEDNAVNQKLVVRLLENRGCRVTSASNGAQALALLAEKRVDLILMDVQMPAIDGIEATKAIRMKEKLTGGHVPIVALTAYAMSGDEARCLGAGMDGYLAKPVRNDELIRVVESFTGRSTTRQPARRKVT